MSEAKAAAVATEEIDHQHGGSHAGRPSSWVAVAIVFLGFVVGGVALCVGPNWVVFVVGAVIVAVGLVACGVVHLFSDVVVDAPRVIPEIVDYSLFGHSTERRRGGSAEEPKRFSVRTDTQQFPHG
ncbi:HGxxPAAW family protein [Actinomadura oligospora]|uniref:HGxxPAAW family protein n=1 Tax=Actinomadura oligospora TaxID=111804 RepID=UPI0004BBAE8D|nr:HGxxPAAW family protein [Actinomadura oligospora]